MNCDECVRSRSYPQPLNEFQHIRFNIIFFILPIFLNFTAILYIVVVGFESLLQHTTHSDQI